MTKICNKVIIKAVAKKPVHCFANNCILQECYSYFEKRCISMMLGSEDPGISHIEKSVMLQIWKEIQ